ncbi:MAG: TetR/AcrR family transcriptional regulator [Sphingomonadales bacterium]|nr:TetR/AcrR family transcriptional regulator [Sphingomonadales bacterium]
MATSTRRRPRDPVATREVILEAAGHLLAKDGPEGISLSEVAHLAGVNRGTAYQHFETRENLIQATVQWVSDRLFRAAFGDPETIGERRVEEVDTQDLTDRVARYAMDNPELCRVWLMQLLASPDPSADMFWREYQGSLERFARTDMAVAGVDSQALAVLTLSGLFLWPVWARARGGDAAARAAEARRIADECLRLSMYGSMRAECFPAVAARLRAAGKVPGGR